MRWNWGTGVVIAFVLFISFIMYFVVRTNTDSSLEHDLVTEEYYKKELQYQQQLSEEQRSVDEGMEVEIEVFPEGLRIEFPASIPAEEISGRIELYRPSDKNLDRQWPLENIHDQVYLLHRTLLAEGRWDVNVVWTWKGNTYRTRKAIHL